MNSFKCSGCHSLVPWSAVFTSSETGEHLCAACGSKKVGKLGSQGSKFQQALMAMRKKHDAKRDSNSV